MEQIFKSYDIRGVYPEELNENLAYRIGAATAEYLKAHVLAVGQDNRASSPALFASFVQGVRESGVTVIDLGLLSTPMLYFAATKLAVDGAIMVTASHNPAQYNGFKICKKNAVPVGLSSGLGGIRDLVLSNKFLKAEKLGELHVANIKNDYDDFIVGFANFSKKRFHVAIDTAHAMGVLELPIYHRFNNIMLCGLLYDTLRPPGTCPHEANPQKAETLIELQHVVRKTKADIGIAYDGDADRIGFIDEEGRVVPMDITTALLAQGVLALHPKATILYDLRSSRSVREVIEEHGGTAHECMVGHANIKKQMIAEGAVFAGEASGHYYFAEGGYIAEMGTLPALLLFNLMNKTGKKLSQLVREVTRYVHSGEINSKVNSAPDMLKRIKKKYADGKISELDGIKIEYPNWWFSLRASNTEPLIRLNCEADTKELMEKMRDELLVLIHSPA